jgi:anaerobic magnesium-protoporphyrin IX monomethyl ester cyclase
MKSKQIYLIYTSNSRLYPYFPSSSLALAGVLLKKGYEPRIIDTELEDWEKHDISAALFVCVSTFTGPWLGSALNITRKIKDKYPGMKVFWGGPHAIALPEVTASHPLIDAVCYTEGENTIAELADAVYSGNPDYSRIGGLMYRTSEGAVARNPASEPADLDSLDLPPYHLLNRDLYSVKQGRVYYQSSRGCPFRCRFCVCENRTKWRGMSPEKVIADFKKIKELFNPGEIQIFDGNFFANPERVRKILKMKVESGLDFNWSAYCRFDTFARFSKDDLGLLRESKCIELKFGGESASMDMLKYIEKETKPEHIPYGVKTSLEYGITPTLSFITGFPVEKRKDLDETLNMIKKLKKENKGLALNGLFMLQHLPNTPLTQEVLEKYDIEQPDTLEGWVTHHMTWTTRKDYPWMTNGEYSLRRTLSSIVGYEYISEVLRKMPLDQRKGTMLGNPALFGLFRLVDLVVRKVFIPLRWDMGITVFPFEWRIWDMFRKNILRTC